MALNKNSLRICLIAVAGVSLSISRTSLAQTLQGASKSVVTQVSHGDNSPNISNVSGNVTVTYNSCVAMGYTLPFDSSARSVSPVLGISGNAPVLYWPPAVGQIPMPITSSSDNGLPILSTDSQHLGVLLSGSAIDHPSDAGWLARSSSVDAYSSLVMTVPEMSSSPTTPDVTSLGAPFSSPASSPLSGITVSGWSAQIAEVPSPDTLGSNNALPIWTSYSQSLGVLPSGPSAGSGMDWPASIIGISSHGTVSPNNGLPIFTADSQDLGKLFIGSAVGAAPPATGMQLFPQVTGVSASLDSALRMSTAELQGQGALLSGRVTGPMPEATGLQWPPEGFLSGIVSGTDYESLAMSLSKLTADGQIITGWTLTYRAAELRE